MKIRLVRLAAIGMAVALKKLPHDQNVLLTQNGRSPVAYWESGFPLYTAAQAPRLQTETCSIAATHGQA